jgi:glycosyltransferase involved in cell wall biosynthesis
MKILTNEFAVNLPGSKKMAQGGTATLAGSLAKFLADRGHVRIGVVSVNTHDLRHSIEKRGRNLWALNFPFAYYKKVTQAKSLSEPRRYLRSVIDDLKGIIELTEPDVVFINGFFTFTWALMVAAHQAGVPIVVKHAGIWNVEVEIYKDLFSDIGLKVMKEMERDITRLRTHEIFLNEFSRKKYVHLIKLRPAHSYIVPLPYYKQKYPAQLSKKIKKEYHIGVVARWDRIKNHQAILELARSAREAGLQWTFHAVTSIPKTNKYKEFKKAYRKFIKIEKPMNKNMLIKFYHKMDLMILPSHFDVSPNVVMEATLAGTATLISPNVGWVSMYKKNDASKLIIDFADTNKVIARMKDLVGHGVPRKIYSEIKSKHDPDKVFNEYFKIFKKVI